MQNNPLLYDTTLSGIAMTVTSNGTTLDLGAKGSHLVSYHIDWEDVAITWILERSDFSTSVVWDDFTATYRIGDPGWVDPVLGDPRQNHVVAIENPGTRFVRLGYSGGNFGGAAVRLRVVAYINRVFK